MRKIKTAFLFFQEDYYPAIEKEFEFPLTGDQIMTELSLRWRQLSESDRMQYIELEARDRQRYHQETRNTRMDTAAGGAAEITTRRK